MFAGFDLGAKLGYAFVSEQGQRVFSGTLKLGKRTPDSLKLAHSSLSELLYCHCPTIVGYEKVTFFGRGVKAAHAYGSYEAALWIASRNYDPDIQIELFTVQQVKKAATGFSDATKEEIESSVLTRWVYLPDDDNEADALWIAECTRRRFLGESV